MSHRRRPKTPILTAGPLAEETIRWMLGRGFRCYLCNGEPSVAGCFVPNDQVWCKAPPGKTRTYWYMLCECCVALPDVGDRAHAKVLGEIACWPDSPEVN
jgi:hypothetical protein